MRHSDILDTCLSMESEISTLSTWWRRTVEEYTGLSEVFHENFRIRCRDVPVGELAALLNAAGVEQQETLDPSSGVYTLSARWATGCIRVYNARPGAVPDFMRGAVAQHAKRAHANAHRKYTTVSISCLLPAEQVGIDLLRLLTPYSVPPRRARLIAGRRHTINVLTAGPNGLSAEPFDMPKERCKLVAGNYAADIVERFPSLVKFIQGRTPLDAGRLVLIDGPPGTGKTFLLQALLAHKSTCVLIPGAAGAMLDNPAFVPWVVNFCREANGITLVVEDADELLRDRNQGGSLSALSGLLNATSGMMATLTNLRIVASINTDRQASTVDPAVLRAGRLFLRLHIGTLSKEQARAVVLRESGSELAAARVPDAGLSLADCYAYARALGAPEPA